LIKVQRIQSEDATGFGTPAVESAEPKRRSSMNFGSDSIARWVGYLVGVLVAVVVLALAIGTCYQYVENRRDLQEHPAPGQLVDIGGRRLHLWCTGAGFPVVVLEVGGSGNVLEWSRVQPEVAKTTRVCSYDRAGFGWSDLGPNPRSAAQIVGELHTLLQAAQVPGPYVLTGHSIGGLFVRLFASTYPTEVAGIILVDATHEDLRQRMPAESGAQAGNPLMLQFTLDLHSFLTAVGFARLTGIRFAGGPALSPEARTLAEGIKVRTTVPFADRSETLTTDESMTQVRKTRHVLDIPLVVLTRGPYVADPTIPTERRQRQERNARAWAELQRDLVTLSSRGTQVVAAKPGHYVHLVQPEIVIDAIGGVVSQVRLGPGAQ
jgi:pimeloyl-ACP methyl ester carboxylesterase